MLNLAMLEVTAGLEIVYEAFSFIKRYFGAVVFAAPHLCTHSLC
jgi:hypothetical protein